MALHNNGKKLNEKYLISRLGKLIEAFCLYLGMKMIGEREMKTKRDVKVKIGEEIIN